MGIDTSCAQFLFCARALGADFKDSLMIGRQFFYSEPAALDQIFRLHKITREVSEFSRDAQSWGDALFRLLGATTVSSMDVSPFEGANLIHDLNVPVDVSLKNRFSVVYDGGTLEHVFDFPQALRNCMEMVSEGGWFIQICPANNLMGHGFYQISPELVYRVFSPENGYEIVAVLLHEAVRGGRWYKVADPAVVGRRVQMTNRFPTYICTLARRIRVTPILQRFPQQNDYAVGWQRPQEHSGGVYRRRFGLRARVTEVVRRYLPANAERFVRWLYTPALETQEDCYRRIHVRDLIVGQIS